MIDLIKPEAMTTMIELIRSYSMPVGSTLKLDQQADDFLDQHGVIRRSSSSLERSLLQRGASDGKLDYLAVATLTEPLNNDEGEVVDGDTSSDSSHHDPKPTSPEELEALIQAQIDKKRRRSEMIASLKERKHTLLAVQCAQVQDRLQLWYDASELDPAVETSAEHTPLSPSSKAQHFIDSDGNIRRKSIVQPDKSSISSPPPSSPVADFLLSHARKSLVLEFLQSIIDD